MRNWNTVASRCFAVLMLCFDRTYEELKPHRIPGPTCDHHVLIVPMRNWNPFRPAGFAPANPCFDRTYEELKLSVHVIFARYAVSFDRTYEELKLNYPPGAMLPFCVLIVPMRNWNTIIKAVGDFPFVLFWSYLWGIETKYMSIPHRKCS